MLGTIVAIVQRDPIIWGTMALVVFVLFIRELYRWGKRHDRGEW